MRRHAFDREFLKKTAAILAAVLVHGFSSSGKTAADSQANKPLASKKILIAYFSHSGNTRYVAQQIQARVGGELFEIKTVRSYSQDYDTVVEQAEQEKKSNARPKLVAQVADLAAYDIVFVGYPNWWATMPMAVFTFFENNDLQGKTLAPFCTHEGSALGRSVADMKKLNPKSTVLEGLAIRGSRIREKSTQRELDAWLGRLDIKKKSN